MDYLDPLSLLNNKQYYFKKTLFASHQLLHKGWSIQEDGNNTILNTFDITPSKSPKMKVL